MRTFKLTTSMLALIAVANVAFSQSKPKTDSITVAVYPKYDKVSAWHKDMFGRNYRKIWATPVKMRVLTLSKEKGGLAITELGGGNQTHSLQLKDSAGNEWVLRTVVKDPEKGLPKYLKKTIVSATMFDFVSTSHPYSALTVPPMADALGIPHTHPEIVYVGDDPGLGKYRKEFANQVFLFEEHKPLGDKKVEKTDKVLEKLEKSSENRYNEKLLLRARLLDMIIGDWDRHEKQWRWIEDKRDSADYFTAMPTDRDKVFNTSSGFLLGLYADTKPQLQPYRNHIKKIDHWNENNPNFDLDFLNGLSEQDWLEQINYVQTHLTDQVITDAIKRLPPNIYTMDGKKLTQITIARRNNIKEDAMSYYRFLAKKVDVVASDKKETFNVEYLPDGKVKVTASNSKQNDTSGIFYQRTFDPAVTREVRIYGIGGKDDFKVSGNSSSPIKVRLIGGKDDDKYEINSPENSGNIYVYDRTDKKNELPPASTAHIKTSSDSLVNSFDPQGFKYDHSGPLVSLGYSPEDGIRLIGGYSILKHGFRKYPYASKQQLEIGYTLGRKSFISSYKGDFKGVFGDWNLEANIRVRGPRNVNNFFGFGNDSQYPNAGSKTFSYYRNRYDLAVVDIRTYRQYDNWQVNAGVIGQYYTSSAANNQGLFFQEFSTQHPEVNLYGQKYYAGAVAGLIYDTRGNKYYPTDGVWWETNITGLTGLNQSNHTNGSVLSTFCFYLNPDRDSIFVIANRTGAGHFVGNGEFFQMMNIGGPASLQGYHTSRFIGNTSVYNNTEIRLKLFEAHTYLLPATWGLIAYNDIGRVWYKGENSSTIHDAVGGGLFVMPFHAFVFQTTVGYTKENTLFYFQFGFRY